MFLSEVGARFWQITKSVYVDGADLDLLDGPGMDTEEPLQVEESGGG